MNAVTKMAVKKFAKNHCPQRIPLVTDHGQPRKQIFIMDTFRNLAKITSIITFIAFCSSCAATKDGRKTQFQGAALGAVAGAGVGALLGLAAGGPRGAAIGAVAGAVAGGTGGFLYGSHVAHQKAKYASTEQWLDQCIASAQQTNNKAYAYNRTLKQRIAALEIRSKSAIASNNKAAIRQIHTEIAGLRKEATQQQQQVNHEIAAQKGASGDQSARSATNYGAYSKQMSELSNTQAGLSRNIGRLASLENQVNL